MERRSFLRHLPQVILLGIVTADSFKSLAVSADYVAAPQKSSSKKDSFEILKEIYQEVMEPGSLGSRDEDKEFIKREFFMDIDGNEENKEEHVVVLIHRLGDSEKMIIQVTYFESKRDRSATKYAENTKKIVCFIKGEKVEVAETEYTEKEFKSLLPEILRNIRNKKKILKSVYRKK
ncbi:MAG: hypothetical protein ACETWK_01260 [Candidatus Aminicenantaceae bacterium]